MIVYVWVAFDHLSQSVAVLELQLFCFGIEDSSRYRQIVHQPKYANKQWMKNGLSLEHSRWVIRLLRTIHLQMHKVFMLNTLGNFARLFIIPVERLVFSIA